MGPMKTLMVSLWDPSDDGDDGVDDGDDVIFKRCIFVKHCFSILYVQRYLSISRRLVGLFFHWQ